MGGDSPVQDDPAVLHREVGATVYHAGKKWEGVLSVDLTLGHQHDPNGKKPYIGVDWGGQEVGGSIAITYMNPEWYWWLLGAPGARDDTDFHLVHAPGHWEIPGTAAHGVWVGKRIWFDETWRPQSDRELRFARAAAKHRGIAIVETAVFGVYQAVPTFNMKDLVRSEP